ncbi:MAG TPA: hypothetical protein VF656_04120 [Pyrinomonadaceae bacterium]|jgi:uncharacterized repeat protein (TIGR01451 family)
MKHARANSFEQPGRPSRIARAGALASFAVRAARQLFFVVSAVCAFACAASAQVNIYQLRGSTVYDIYTYNTTTNTVSTVYSNYPITPNVSTTNSATLAQRPSDGMLFYVMFLSTNNPVMYRFNPATPNVAPVQVGTGLGAAVPSSLRMAFNPVNGLLYYLPDSRILYTIDTTTGVASATGITAGAAVTSGGDMAFSSTGQLYVITSGKTLYTVSLVNGTATRVGNAAVNFTDSPANAQPDATLGLAFDAAGRLLTQTRNPNRIYSIGLPVASTATPQGTFVSNGDGDINSTGDMASASVPAPNLSITKTDNATTVYRGGTVTYTIVVTNNSTFAVTGTVADNVPASLTSVTWNCTASAGSSCTTASGTGNNISTSATLEAGGTATYTITGTLSATATGTLSNTASVQPPAWLADSTPADNTATDNSTINLNANLSITKTDNLSSVNPGSSVTYTVVVGNAGPDAANGALVTDTVPAALTGVAWTCGSPVGGATCGAASGTGNNISTTANLPSGGSVTYTITGTLSATATGTLSNTAQVLTPATGVTDPNDPARTGANNNSATDTTTINLAPDLRITKTHTGNFTVGAGGTYTLTASNAGTGASSGTITVTDTLPTGLTVASVPTGTGWNCSATVVGSSAATCTSTNVINAGVTSPNPITLTVAVAPAALAASPVTNVASISGGGEPASLNGNNSVNDSTIIVGAPDLTITKTHTGNFTRGGVGTYDITVTNSGTAATTGATVTVTDTLPAGLTPTAPIGLTNGWTCGIAAQVVTCQRANALGAGASYPVINITVSVSQTAAASVTNTASVAGGGEPASLNGNNSASDPTTIVSSADLSLTKTANNSAPTINQNVTFTLTVTNAGPTNATGISLRDQLPAGLSFVSAAPAAYNNATGVWTVGAVDSGSSATLQLIAKVTASGTITNKAEVIASGVPDPDSTPDNNNAAEDDQASAQLGVPQPPDVRLQKRCTSPANCETAPQQPGTELTYTITFTNTAGTSAAQGLTIVDVIPFSVDPPNSAIVRSTEFKVGSMTFSPGTSGLSITATGYKFYNDAINFPAPAPPWTPAAPYTPAGTFDPNVTYVAWQLTGSMPPGTSGSVSFTVRIR